MPEEIFKETFYEALKMFPEDFYIFVFGKCWNNVGTLRFILLVNSNLIK